VVQSVKGVILGSPFASSQAIHERLSKVKGLAIFSSDALSSSAYATEEILLVLLLAGSTALTESLPIAALIAILIGIVTLSYRQTIQAYPGGGGAYIVALRNLGRWPGLVAGAALLVDYVLTVSVSTAAGVAAVTSAIPDLHDLKMPIGVAVIVLLTLGNLRGIREAGSIFAIPTYIFIFSMGAVIAIGFAKVIMGDAPGTLGSAAPPEEFVEAQQGLTLFLLMRAFSSGCAALTGIEAISNGVPNFKEPEVPNARTTMVWMAGILTVLFLGITFLSSRFGFVPSHDETIVSELGRTVLGENVLYYGFQVATATVLFLAANTSYSAFPPLGANLARDHFLPRQFTFRGDRLAYSNGILMLSGAAIALLVAFNAEVSRLIPLYALGVFVSFTLSQGGMVVHIRRERLEGWKWAAAISALGCTATLVVAVVIGLSKFTAGAYISILMMIAMMALFSLIRRHYDWYEKIIAISDDDASRGVPSAAPREASRDHVIVPIDGINRVSLGAIGMARAISANVTAVHLTDDLAAAEQLRQRWERVAPDVPLLIIDSPYRAFAAPMIAYMELLERTEPDKRITVILPGFKAHHWWERLLHNQAVRRLRPLLEEDERITVVDFDYDVSRDENAPSPPSAASV
jgi:amino acid transporter